LPKWGGKKRRKGCACFVDLKGRREGVATLLERDLSHRNGKNEWKPLSGRRYYTAGNQNKNKGNFAQETAKKQGRIRGQGLPTMLGLPVIKGGRG